jgi:hypothetical protein
LIVECDPDSCGVGDGIKFEEDSFEFGRGDLQGVDFDEFLECLSVY